MGGPVIVGSTLGAWGEKPSEFCKPLEKAVSSKAATRSVSVEIRLRPWSLGCGDQIEGKGKTRLFLTSIKKGGNPSNPTPLKKGIEELGNRGGTRNDRRTLTIKGHSAKWLIPLSLALLGFSSVKPAKLDTYKKGGALGVFSVPKEGER